MFPHDVAVRCFSALFIKMRASAVLFQTQFLKSLVAKASFGFSPSQMHYMNAPPNSPSSPTTFVANKNWESPPPISIGNSALHSSRRNLLQSFESLSPVMESMPNFQEVPLPLPTAESKPPLYPVPTSNMEHDPYVETLQPVLGSILHFQIGSQSGIPRRPETCHPFPQTYEWSLTGPYGPL